MEKALVKNSLFDKFKKVFDYDDVHYFYWPIEIGVSYVDFDKLRIPYLPIKFFDYEPIKIVHYNNNKVILSRFHYKLLTYFNKPFLENDKPIIKFYEGSHTPLIYTIINDEIEIGQNARFPKGVNSKEIDAFIILQAIFAKIMERSIIFDENDLLDIDTYEINKFENPGDDLLLKVNEMNAIFYIGSYPSPDEMKAIGYFR